MVVEEEGEACKQRRGAASTSSMQRESGEVVSSPGQAVPIRRSATTLVTGNTLVAQDRHGISANGLLVWTAHVLEDSDVLVSCAQTDVPRRWMKAGRTNVMPMTYVHYFARVVHAQRMLGIGE